MAEITYQMILSTIQTAGLLVGISYYILSLRNQNRARKTQLYLQMVNKFSEPYMNEAQGKAADFEWATADDFMVDWKNPERRVTLGIEGAWYEGLGVLVKENLLDIRVVALLLSSLVARFWEKLIPIIDKVREAHMGPRFWTETEYLYNQLMKYTKEHPELAT